MQPPRLTRFRQWLLVRDPERKLPWQLLLEILLVIFWAMWVSRRYLDFSLLEWPHGREFGMAIHPHYIWTLLPKCGDCVLWNGMYNGGSPAFVELHAAILHPLVILATLIWGGFNGAKVVLIGSLVMAGLGQLWLGRVMRLGTVPRLWGAMLVVTGGHLAGRMEIGVVGVVLSTAACSLAIAPALQLAVNGRRRDAIILGLILALAIVSGQGYLQLGFAIAILPALAVFLADERLKLRAVWKEFVLAGLLALLLAGPFIIPFVHFWPEFGKELDPEFSAAQPIEYIPLNFVVNDKDFYWNPLLGKQPHAYLYMNYIGWTPILLAIVPLLRARRSQRKYLLFLVLALVFVILASSALPFKWLAQFLPDFAYSIRNPSLIQGLGVPLIATMAAWGVDLILKQSWPLARIATSGKQSHKRILVILTWVFTLLILFRSLDITYHFSFDWFFLSHQEDVVVDGVLEDMQTTDTQWVSLPFGEHFWGPLAAEKGLKLAVHWRPSYWREHITPFPFIRAAREPVDHNQAEFIDQHADIGIMRLPENEYASIQTSDGNSPCSAQAQGGHIEVTCESERPGELVIYENMWEGWTASRDGAPISLLPGHWLRTEAPAGLHHYQFRYKPWDVPVGLGLMVVGLLLAAGLGIHESLSNAPSPALEPAEEVAQLTAAEDEVAQLPEEVIK